MLVDLQEVISQVQGQVEKHLLNIQFIWDLDCCYKSLITRNPPHENSIEDLTSAERLCRFGSSEGNVLVFKVMIKILGVTTRIFTTSKQNEDIDITFKLCNYCKYYSLVHAVM